MFFLVYNDNQISIPKSIILLLALFSVISRLPLLSRVIKLDNPILSNPILFFSTVRTPRKIDTPISLSTIAIKRRRAIIDI